jgi:hypothetical protein
VPREAAALGENIKKGKMESTLARILTIETFKDRF